MRILSKEAKRIVVLTSNGTRLTCRPVRKLPVQDLLFKLGVTGKLVEGASASDIQAALTKVNTAEQVDQAKAAMALFNYVMAYGVVDDPPVEAVEELQALGVAPTNANALRATWLNYLVLEDSEEAGLLSGVIMALTFKGDEPAILEQSTY